MKSRNRIREAQLSDADRLVALWFALQEEHTASDDRFNLAPDAKQRFANEVLDQIHASVVRLAVAETDEALAGFISARHWLPDPIFDQRLEVYIESIYVMPAFRRSGIGSTLVSDVRRWAIEKGAVRLRLATIASNKRAISFWSSISATPDILGMTIEL